MLIGQSQPTTKSLRLQPLAKEYGSGSQLFAICVKPTYQQLEKEKAMEITLDVSRVLQQFNRIFDEPKSLPPEREFVHCITLKECAGPVNVRPYRNAYFQKNEIEKQVRKMLKKGIIRPSQSTFSSPVLPVKKKKTSRGDFA